MKKWYLLISLLLAVTALAACCNDADKCSAEGVTT